MLAKTFDSSESSAYDLDKYDYSSIMDIEEAGELTNVQRSKLLGDTFSEEEKKPPAEFDSGSDDEEFKQINTKSRRRPKSACQRKSFVYSDGICAPGDTTGFDTTSSTLNDNK